MNKINQNKIKDIVIAITYRCNSRCKMCNIWQKTNHNGEITLKSLNNLPKNLSSINISGGEPFLRPDITEIIKTIKKRCPRVSIIISSNGFAGELILKKMCELIKIEPNIGIAFSIDGINEKHNAIRNIPNGYNKILKTINSLKKLGINNLKIGFTLGDYNTKELPKVYELSKKLNMEFSLAIVHSSDHYFSAKNYISQKKALLKQLDWLIDCELSTNSPKKWLRAYFAHGIKHLLTTGRRILPDYSGKLNIFINPKGDIYANDVSSTPIGKLDENNFIITKKTNNTPNWMVCTARQSIKKHWVRVAVFILIRKFKLKKNISSKYHNL